MDSGEEFLGAQHVLTVPRGHHDPVVRGFVGERQHTALAVQLDAVGAVVDRCTG